MIYFNFYSNLIDAIGYDAQRAVLEVRLYRDNRVRRYFNVPEDIWYRFRESAHPDVYYRKNICGRFPESAGRRS